MIIYGDSERWEAAEAVRTSVLSALAAVRTGGDGSSRHGALVDAFVRAGELAQGLADADFERYGFDVVSRTQRRGAAVLLAFAHAILQSRGGGRDVDGSTLDEIARQLAALPCGGLIRTRTCEGYAHYAVMPESYLAAARQSGLDSGTCVIGLRSIGIGLAALVSAGLGAEPPISLRPAGHPFDREIRASPDLIVRAVGKPGVRFAIVDEGPGLSGSSFAAAARWLTENGVGKERIHFFPSHGGEPGQAASERTRALWRDVPRHVCEEDILLAPDGLVDQLRPLIGPLTRPLEDISAGRWRRKAGVERYAPVDLRFERRKFLAHAESGPWLVKFAGLGAVGQAKLRRARALADAGFTPDVAGLCRGFIVERWITHRTTGVPLWDGSARSDHSPDRSRLMDRLADYIAYRAAHLRSDEPGAPLEKLREMSVHNTGLALGSTAGAVLERLLREIGTLAPTVRPIEIDGRLHAWEWIATPGGLVKVDAIDHCQGHDLIGCQDVAWDVAGAIVEHGFSAEEYRALCRRMAERGVGVDPRLIRALLPCYLAFQLGLWSSAVPPSSSGPTISGRRAAFYGEGLRQLLERTPIA